mgnify:CR=1 FL=1
MSYDEEFDILDKVAPGNEITIVFNSYNDAVSRKAQFARAMKQMKRTMDEMKKPDPYKNINIEHVSNTTLKLSMGGGPLILEERTKPRGD